MDKKFSYALGRRKTATATVRVYETAGKSTINEKDAKTLYTSQTHQLLLAEPFKVADLDPDKYMFTAKAMGGGKYAQLDALRLGISRAIIKLFPEKKKVLKDSGLLTRDPRMVERKKPGLRKARKAEQFSKR